MLRVLLVAPTIDATDVGEAWVAYQWAAGLAPRCDLTVLTYRKRGAPRPSSQLPGVRVVEWDEPPLLGRAERLNSLMKPGYLPFHRNVRRWLRSALAAGETFDVAHQPVPVATRYPSPLRGFAVPYVIGPVGGGLSDPPGFETSDSGPWYMNLRRLDATRLRRDPWLRETYASAACVLGIAPYVADHLADVPLRRFEVMSETGLTALPEPPARVDAPGPLRLLFVGRLVRTKGAREAIRALALLGDLDVRLDLVGDGFDRSACERLVDDLGLRARVRFHGALPHAEAMRHYATADVFFFPSYREPGGNVVFEAMGAGLPLIVCDRGGPAAAVDDTCAIAVPVRDPEQFVSGLADAVRSLAADPDARRRMGERSRERLREVGLWSSKIDAALALYAEVLDG